MTLGLNVHLAKFLQMQNTLAKYMTPQLNIHSANILCKEKCDMPSSDRGPWLI